VNVCRLGKRGEGEGVLLRGLGMFKGGRWKKGEVGCSPGNTLLVCNYKISCIDIFKLEWLRL
jgi:hypothetical protein